MQLNLTYQVPFKESLNGNDFVIEGTAINETTTSNNHKFLSEELIPAASTLTGCPLLVDHENKVENIKGRVLMGAYNEMGKKVDFKAVVMDELCKQMIKDGRLNSVSVGAMVKDVEERNGELIPRGITFKELSLVAVPADSNATFNIAMSNDFGIALKEAYSASKQLDANSTSKLPVVNALQVESVATVETANIKEIESEDLKKGIEYERKEHPSLSEDVIKRIATDHLNEDEDYYEDEDETEVETEDKANIQIEGAGNPVKDTPIDNSIEMKGGLENMSEEIAAKVDENAVLKEQIANLTKMVEEMKASKVEAKVLKNEFEEADAVEEKGYRIEQNDKSFSYIASKY